MIELIDSIDKEVLVWLNGFHNSFMDTIMWYVSSAPFWIWFYVILLAFLLKTRSAIWPKVDFKQLAFIVVSISVAILLADQISSGFFKPFFGRLRPSHSPELEGLVHLLTNPDGEIYKGGQFGFVSSHAANSFAIAWFASALLQMRKAWVIMMIWAALVSYSRIYLGVHYLGDITGGAIIGMLSGAVAAKLYFYLNSKWTN